MSVLRKRMKCMEVAGGRMSYQASYDMPGLSMHVWSRRSDHSMHGGGEVHYISSCASGRITRLLMADICGSESIFKRLATEMRDGLMRNINSIWQNRCVTQLSKRLLDFSGLDGFATAAVATYFSPTRSFAMCNMGNPPPLVYRARERAWTVMHGEQTDQACDRSTDGVMGGDEYRHIQAKFDEGDIFVLYGNGFAQSVFPEGSYVGHAKLLSALKDSPHSDQACRLQHLIRLIQNDGDQAPAEDSTIIVCEVSSTPVRLRDNFLAPLRLLRRPSDATQLT